MNKDQLIKGIDKAISQIPKGFDKPSLILSAELYRTLGCNNYKRMPVFEYSTLAEDMFYIEY